MFSKMILLLILSINVLMYTSVAADNDAVKLNPSFTEITARVLPLKYSDQAILWKRSPVSENGKMMIKRASTTFSSSSETGSPPPSSHRSSSNESIDSLVAEFKNLKISPPRRQKSFSAPSSPARSSQLPPRSPNRSPASTGGGALSHRRKSPSKLSSESHDPANVPKKGGAQARDGHSHCSCRRVGGVCGC
ncbi:uncharacterized protein FA14DRAFT_181690 [Meira miltonrushii]|uniref:Uncharacterized protein n=1 Tax=Meira miltonrushii TaxID=1280837 RepID=A0A316V6A0_9BASI|nr:uncharacterized protein FA14DRAFT_181690 [Meira miltonrushii]PWN33026.1 hypothetical protein FA14DRAFT_181690 [Meira miltonrushii]